MIADRRTLWGAIACAAALALLPGCGADTRSPDSISTGPAATVTPSLTITSTPSAAAPVTPQSPRTEKWIDLDVGDCLADLPSLDPAVVTVTVVDCATAHSAEVYSRVPVAVNSAVADIANHECALGFSQYTGGPVDLSRYAITYLIDSNQDRTSDNPQPSTVICLLQAADGQRLGESARR